MSALPSFVQGLRILIKRNFAVLLRWIFEVIFMTGLLLLYRSFRSFFYRYRRFWRKLYYDVTEVLTVLAFASILLGIWYIAFNGRFLFA